LAAGLLAGALAVVGLAFAPSAGATADVKTDRYAGTTRYGTAAAIAGQNDFKGATTAILATGENFPDALAASGVAGANTPAPIVLTQSKTYTKEAHDALNAFTNVSKVTIVGGTAAVSTDVENAVKADGFTVTRLAGTNRFGTAAAIAGAAGTIGQVGGKTTALIANGLNYPDALAGGTVAYAAHLPILLVTPNSIPAETSKALADNHIQHAIILGGTAAVSDAVKTQLDTATGSTSDRVAGTTRFGTAAAVGEWAKSNLNWAPTEIELASGVNFPDALAGGPLGGLRHAPILLLASVPDETKKFATDHGGSITNVNCLGGTAPCKEADLQAVATATKGTTTTNQVATDLPELVSAQLKSTRTAAQASPGSINQAGTVVRYTFDEPVTGAAPDANEFWVYESNTDNWTEGDYAEVVSGDNKSVDVLFDAASNCGGTCLGYDEQAEANNLVLATVTRDAVTDGTGNTNPEGDAGISTGSTNTIAAGKTSAPDVTGASAFRQALTPGDVAVDVAFDQPAFVQPAGTTNGNFALVMTDNSEVPCVASGDTSVASGGTSACGSGTSTITVTCGLAEGGSSFTPTAAGGASGGNVARVVVEQGAVARTSAGANPNPLEAADVSNTGNGSGPDLVTAIFSPDAIANSDIVAYVFDEPISDPPLADAGTHAPCPAGGGFPSASFNVYYADGSQNSPDFACVQRAQNNDSVVLAGFLDHVLDNAVGVSVEDSAVTGFKAAPNDVNHRDEVGVAPTTAASTTTGRTGSPDLIKVEIQPFTDALGIARARAIYTFDEDVPDSYALAAPVPNNTEPQWFHLYDQDGIELTCNSFETQTASARASDREVICASFNQDTASTAATTAQISNAKLGTVESDAVEDADGHFNPEGAEVTTARA